MNQNLSTIQKKKINTVEGVILAHYTDFTAFDGIFSKGEMWLNSCRYMNDAKEMFYFIEKLLEEAYQELSKSEIDFVKAEYLKQKEKRKNEWAYIMCLSKNLDEASQWDRYGKRGNGICIEFEQKYLEQLFSDNLFVNDVWYGVVSERHKIDLIGWARDDKHRVADGLEDANGLFGNIWAKSMMYKHPSFQLENEVRITSLPFDKSPVLNMDENFIEKYVVLPTGFRKCLVVKWKELSHKKNVNIEDLIHRILIGANSKTDISAMQHYLNYIGMDCLIEKVEKSECPLR